MQWFFLAIIVICFAVLASGPLVNADPKVLARSLRIAGGLAAMGSAALLFFIGRTGFALPLAGLGIMLLGRGMGPLAGFGIPGGNAQKSTGQTSTVRTLWLEMDLDHDTGDMSGRFLKGPLAGRSFTDLGQEGLIKAHDELLGIDGQSAQLLEAYLDRQFDNWRGDQGGKAGARANAAPGAGRSGPMSLAEAYEILGLDPGASPSEIRDAHRRLMKKLHPDQGGSTFLAAKVNQAKDMALENKR